MDVDQLVTAGAYLAAGLLVVAGASKLRLPDGAMTTLNRLHLPAGRLAARVVGLCEVAGGLTILAIGGVVAAATTAVAYGLFTAVAVGLRSAQQDCGCFGGSAGAPMSVVHVALNGLLAAVGAMGLVYEPVSVAQLMTEVGGMGIAAAAILVATGTGLLITILGQSGDRLSRSGLAGRA